MDSALIERFFNKQCTPVEAKQVALYLKANPSLLEKYVSKDEWNHVTYTENFSQQFWDDLWLNINKRNKAKVVGLWLKRFAVAASVLLVITSVYYLQHSSKPVITVAAAKTKSPAFKRERISNTTKTVMHVVLNDGSVVMLAPASSIYYSVPFQNNKREILLEGEAEFHVTKNKLKPFTVYAGALATTALGTVFSVKKNSKKNSITVKLTKGKVVIQSTDKNLKGWNKDVYLLPGDQMNFNTTTALLTVQKANVNINQSAIAKIKFKQPVLDTLQNELVFNNTKLSKVIEKLSSFYSMRIQYDSVLIDTIKFTGTVSKTDSLPVILKAIGEMNELDIQKNEDGFIISKLQQ